MKTQRNPWGINKEVQRQIEGKIQYSSSYISMVRKGQRKNDTVLLAIITVDHNRQLEYKTLN